MNFNNELHEELFCCFIAEGNSSTYRLWDRINTVKKMQELMIMTINEYELQYLDRNIHEERIEYQGLHGDRKIKYYYVDENKQGNL